MNKKEAKEIIAALKDYDLHFKQTCIASPEQYDVFLSGKQVAYIRLRHGYLSVECPDVNGEQIYSYEFKDERGSFENETERKKYMEIISSKIKLWIKTNIY